MLFLAEGSRESWYDFMWPPQTWTLRTLSVTRVVCKAQVLQPTYPKPTPPGPGKPPVALYQLFPRANESPINNFFCLLGTNLEETWL